MNHSRGWGFGLVLFEPRKHSLKVGECLGELPEHARRLVMQIRNPYKHPRTLLKR